MEDGRSSILYPLSSILSWSFIVHRSSFIVSYLHAVMRGRRVEIFSRRADRVHVDRHGAELRKLVQQLVLDILGDSVARGGRKLAVQLHPLFGLKIVAEPAHPHDVDPL